jgi:hypothetical protein
MAILHWAKFVHSHGRRPLTPGFSDSSLGSKSVQQGAEMPTARLAQASDLESLLDLFRVSEVSSIADPTERIERIWSETLAREGLALLSPKLAHG